MFIQICYQIQPKNLHFLTLVAQAAAATTAQATRLCWPAAMACFVFDP